MSVKDTSSITSVDGSAPTKKTKKLLAAYAFIGTDELMRKQTVERLKAYVDPSFATLDIDELSASSDLSEESLTAALETFPFGGRKVVVIYGLDKLSKALQETLIRYLKNPNETTVLLGIAERLSSQTRLYKAISRFGSAAIIRCSEKKGSELFAFVAKLAQQHGIELQPDAAQELVLRVGSASLMLDTTLTHLATITKANRLPQPLSREVIARFVKRVVEVKPWGLLDALGRRNFDEIWSLYQQLEGSPLGLISLITQRLREYMCARALYERNEEQLGLTLQQLQEKLSKQTWQLKSHGRACQQFSAQELRACLQAAKRAEAALKTGADAHTEMLKLIVVLAKRKHGVSREKIAYPIFEK